MAPHDGASTQNSPLAPSVEKAYYRKCIQLKRRLNEVEAANDEAKIRRVRLERAIMKMRVERAFLLDELSKRMVENVDNSEGSADEGMATPPPERPHRDKRRRQTLPTDDPSAPAPSSQPREPSSTRRVSSRPAPRVHDDDSAMDIMDEEPLRPTRRSYNRSSPYHRTSGSRSGGDGRANGTYADDGAERDRRSVNRDAGAVGEALSAGPAIVQGANGERRVLSSGGSGDGGNHDGAAFEGAE